MAFVYKIEEQKWLCTAFRLQHTIWGPVLRSGGFWLFLIFHLILWLCYQYKLIEKYGPEYGVYWDLSADYMQPDWNDIRVITSITTFFEVFYTQRCYDRYVNMHNAVNQVFRSMHRFCFNFKQNFNTANKVKGSGARPGIEYLHLVTRWSHAHAVCFFTELRHGPMNEEHWLHITEIGLLDHDEVLRLKDYTGPQRGFILLDWIARVTSEAHIRRDDHDKGHWRLLMRSLLEVDEAQKSVMDLERMPVPFQYFHMLNMMLIATVSAWAYAMAMSESLFAPLVYVFATFIFIGMLEIAKMFSDPFGDDEVDFPIQIWCDKFLENQLAYINADEDSHVACDQFFQTKLQNQGRLAWQPGEITALIGNRRESKKGQVVAHRASMLVRGHTTQFTMPGSNAIAEDYRYERVASNNPDENKERGSLMKFS